MSRSDDDRVELVPAVQAAVDQLRAQLAEGYGDLFDCAEARLFGVPCDYHRGIHDGLFAMVGHVGDRMMAVFPDGPHQLCDDTLAAIGSVGACHVAWLESVAHLGPDA